PIDGVTAPTQILSPVKPGPPSGPIDGVTAPTQIPGSAVTPATPCCDITAVNVRTGVATAKVNATGQIFQFKAPANVLSSLHVGQGIYANMQTSQVSVDNANPCCEIVSSAISPAIGTSSTTGLSAPATQAASAPTSGDPCCQITSINVRTGLATAKVNATGQTFQF